MKKPTILKSIFFLLIFLQSFVVLSQTVKPFTARFDTSLKGDMLLIGNNILNRNKSSNPDKGTPTEAYNGSGNNNSLTMNYINIDNGATPGVFSSSSANLTIPQTSKDCYKVVYAGLYWSGIYDQTTLDNGTVNRNNLGKVKLKLPSQTAYTDITGSLIYDYNTGTANGTQKPYVYYFDATSMVQALTTAEGTYTVANVISGQGVINGGFSAGWSLFVVYEDPKSSAKYITSYDGFSFIQATSVPLEYDVSGFKTIPSGPVEAKLAFAALEGDAGTSGDSYFVNNTKIKTNERPENNFFNSTINNIAGPYTDRVPNSSNTLGFDTAIIKLNNAGNSIIKNNDSFAKFKLSTSGDGYGIYFNAFNVEIIEPKIVLTKIVKNAAGDNIGGQDVTLGQQLYYEVGLKNTGNDDATSLTIRDQLPINVIFNQADVVLPSGVSIKSYDATTRNIIFEVRDDVVNVGDPEKIISFKVQVVPDCHSLSEACSNSIDNSAYATYFGKENNTFQITDDPSVNSNTGCILVPKATNFLVGIDGCKFSENVSLCTESVQLIPAKGYSTYTWYSDEARTNQIGTGDVFYVKDPGTYYVYNFAKAPCRSIVQSFIVTRFGTTQTNPVTRFANEEVTCTNNGKKLPNIYLCGDEREINTGITDSNNIVWEKSECPLIYGTTCADETTNCDWPTVGTGPDFIAKDGGQYRVRINYTGGCFSLYYFNVYKNELDATETHKDIICNQAGNITIGNVPSGYEYAITTDPDAVASNYQTSNIFPIYNAGTYTVHIRQVGVLSNPCIFKIKNILIRSRNLEVNTFVTQPLCYGEKGSIKVGAMNIDPQYYYYLYNNNNSNVVLSSVGPISNSDYTFANLNPGNTYRVRITNAAVGGTVAPTCDVSAYQYINQPSSAIVAKPTVKTALTACSDGVIKVTTTGGTAPYFYFVNGATTFQLSNEIDVTAAGKYDIVVVDSKNCSVSTSIDIPLLQKPTYTVNSTNSICYTDKAKIEISNIVANGYTMGYSINNGATWSTNPTFSNLQPGNYNVLVRYRIGTSGTYCTDPAQPITITGPSSAVTASAGVAELAGCGTEIGGKPTGLLRITNTQGGTSPYEYNFGDGVWQSSNEKYVVEGTYSLSVKDALGCIYQIPYTVKLDPKPADPIIDSNLNTTYNCNGTATATVVVQNPATTGGATYTYEYYMDDVLNTNTPSNVFINVPSGDHKVTVKYNVSTVSSYSNLLEEDFGNGTSTTSPGISSVYCFEDQVAPFQPCDIYNSNNINDGKYSVTNKIQTLFGGWVDVKDHTSLGKDSSGRFLAINIGGVAGMGGSLYKKQINDIIPNQEVKVSFWVMNLMNTDPAWNDRVDPDISVELINSANSIVATNKTGGVPRTTASDNKNVWVNYIFTLDPKNNTALDFVLKSYNTATNGNDIVIDDIQVYQVPKSCGNKRDFNVNIKTGQSFESPEPAVQNALCFGDTNGSITITAQNFNTTTGFYYSIDNGATFNTSTTSPIVLSGKAAGTYKVVVKNDLAGTCKFENKVVIAAPSLVTLTASLKTLPTCITGATILATAGGGTNPYTYQLIDSAGAIINTLTGSEPVNFLNVAKGVYTVDVTDENNCKPVAPRTVTVGESVKPTATIASTGLCFDGSNASIKVDVANGVQDYSYKVKVNSGVYSTLSPTFTGASFTYNVTASGTYSFIVVDKNGCESNEVTQIIGAKLTAGAAIKTALSCKTPPASNATIEVTINGGTSPYSYDVKNNTGTVIFSGTTTGPKFTYDTAVSGNFTFDIKDKNNCTISTSQIVNSLVAVTANATETDVTCFGASNGSVILEALTGVAPYTFTIAGQTATSVTNTTATYINLPGSVTGITYSYKVIDNNACEFNDTFVVKQPTTIVANASITTAYTCDANASIKATVTSGGNGGFQFILKRGTTTVATNATGEFNNLTVAGIYSVVITDAKGCTLTVPAGEIKALNKPTAMRLTASAVTCPSNQATVTIDNVVGGTGTLTYAITAPASAVTNTTGISTGVFTGLAAGITYTFEVKDANNCKFNKIIKIDALPTISIGTPSKNDVVCLGGTNGSVKFPVSGLAATTLYSYTLVSTPAGFNKSGSGTATGDPFELSITGLSAASYVLTLTNTTTNCTSTQNVTIVAPTMALGLDQTIKTDVTCKALGTAEIKATGGWGSYTYIVKNSAGGTIPASSPKNKYTNLVAGNYSFTVTDLNGCQVTGAFTILDKVLPIASIDAISDFCAGGTGATIVVSPANEPNYTYTLGSVTNTTGTFTGLTPGSNYKVVVKDTSTGCETELTVPTIAQPISAQIKLNRDLSCVSGAENAIIEVYNIANGYPNYKYRVSTTAGSFTGTSQTITGTSFEYPVSTAGTYYFEITDDKGCTTVVYRTINAKLDPTATTTPTNPKCFNGTDGSITVNASSGTAPYTYEFSTTSATTGFATMASNIKANIGAGNYWFKVTDAKKCIFVVAETLANPTKLEATAAVTTPLKCGVGNAAQAAIITVTIDPTLIGTPYAGANKYRYSYNGATPITSNTFTTSTVGTVTIDVYDANGCTVSTSAAVIALDPPTTLTYVKANTITCLASTTDLTVSFLKGVSPFKVEITSTDATIAPATPVATVATNSHTFENLSPGTYFFKVTDANNCTITGDDTIANVTPITVTGALVKAVTCNAANNGEIKFTVGGNSTGYSYVLTNTALDVISGGTQSGNVVTYTNLPGGTTYTITVTNPTTGCTKTAFVDVAEPVAITAFDASATKVYCTQPISTIKVSATGGIAPLYYAISTTAAVPAFPADYNTTGNFTINTSSVGLNYTAYVVDKNGNCIQSIAKPIVSDAAPTIVAQADVCYPGSSFTVTVSGTVYGGTAQYGIGTTAANISYNNNADKTITAPGTYYIGIKDDNNCPATTSFVVNDQLTLTAILDKDITCNFTAPATSNEAQITLTPGGGNGTYSYEVKNGVSGTYTATTAVFTTTGLATGDYYFKVTSGGCTYETTIAVPVTTPVDPTATHNATNLSCFESADGTVTIVPLTGATPFTYSFNGSGFTSNPTYSNLAVSPALGYPYTVRDAKGCEVSGLAIVTQPDQIIIDYETVDMTCPGPTLGSVTVFPIINGVVPFTYELRNKVTGAVLTATGQPGNVNYLFNDLNYGDFVLTVTDATGCSNFRDDVKIIAPPNELDIDLTTPFTTCAAGATIVVAVNPAVVPATPAYEFGIYNNSSVAPFTDNLLAADAGFPLQHTFNNLTPGVVYTFVVYDPTTNCYYFETALGSIDPLTNIVTNATAIPVACKGTATGGVSISINNTDATQIQYEIFYDQSDISTTLSGTITMPTTVPLKVTGLTPGTYYIKFTEVDGTNTDCTSSSIPFTIVESAVPLTVTAVSPINDNCKLDAGQVVATPNGGTGPFTYIINQTATPAPLVSDTWGASNDNIFNVESGSYYVWVKDANNCIQSTTVNVDLDPEPVFALDIVNECAAEGSFSVDVTITDATPTMAPYSVSVNGGGFVSVSGTSYTATGLNSGLQQTIIVKNKNNCPTEHKIDIIPTPVASADVTKVLDCSSTPTTVADAIITLTISKGTTPYTYEVQKGVAAYTAFTPIETVVAGITKVEYPVANGDEDTYTFRITDVNNCPIVTNEVIIDPIVPIVPDYTTIQPLCFGDDNGVIDLSTTTGGQGNYTYTLVQIAPTLGSVESQTTPVFSGLVAGDYEYTITDELGCTEIATATLGEPSAIAVGTPMITGLTCGTGNIGQAATVVLSGTGGSGSYEFSFDGSAFSTENTYTVEDSGADRTIDYIVKDINGCEIASTVTILKLDPPTDFDMTQGAVITCATTSTTVTISNVENGAGAIPSTVALTYQIISPASAAIDNGTDPIFTNLAPGDYVFQVTDAVGCVKQLPFEIREVINIDIVEQSTTGITCLGTDDGKASFFVSGFGSGSPAGTYHYILDADSPVTGLTSPTINLTGLSAGPHTIQVFDDVTGCEKMIPLDFTIDAPTLALAIDSKVVTPLGCTTFGAVTIFAKDGWGDYDYTVTQPDLTVLNNNTGIFGGLTQTGTYDIAVTDANGCEVQDTFELSEPIAPDIAIDTTTDYCYVGTNSTTIVVTASSTSPFIVATDVYEYSIDNGQNWQTSNTFSNLTPGDYTITVKDKFGCIDLTPELITINNQLFASAENKKDIYCTVGNENGTIKIDAVGGYGSYTYTVAKDGAPASASINFPAGSDTADYSVAALGSYVFVVSDAQGCSYTIANAVVMVDPSPVVFTAVPTSPSCMGTQGELGDGSILVTLDVTSIDNPDYTYQITRTAPTGFTSTQVNNGLFTGLVAGTYDVVVTSGRGCSTPMVVTIDPPTAVVAAASASPFTCSATNTLNETIVTVTGTGGAGTDPVADYLFSANGTNWRTTNTFNVIDNGAIQNLTYYVKDANGCVDEVQITIAAFPKLISVVATNGPAIDCNNLQQEMNVVISGGTNTPNAFTYNVYQDGVLITPAPIAVSGNTFTYNATSVGSFYEFEVLDNNTGCSFKSDVYDVPLYNKMKVNASPAANVDCNGNATGAIEINIVDYAGAYDYEVFKGTTSVTTGSVDPFVNPFIIPFGLEAGTNYTVVVTQTAYPSCIVTSNNVIITEPAPLLNNFIVNVKNQNCNTTGAVLTVDVATIVGGTAGYTYAFVSSGSIPVLTDYTGSPTKTIVTTQIAPAFDSYDVYVKDANGCVAFVTKEISLDPLPEIRDVTIDSQCLDTNGYRIDVTADGVAPLKYSLDGVQFQDDAFFIVNATGDYIVTVMDANQCATTATTAITVLAPLTLRAEVELPTCIAADGIITLFAEGGTVVPANSYEYFDKNTGVAQPSNIFTGYAPGTYTFVVRDVVEGCEKELEVLIPNPTQVMGITLEPTEVSCNGGSDGSILVILDSSNNNPEYTYSIDGGLNTQVSPLFTGLTAGNYTVLVTSGRGCTETAMTTVIEPAGIQVLTPTVVPFGCVVENTPNFATITVDNVIGGSSNYVVYEFFRNGISVQSSDVNVYTEYDYTAGSYTVTVTDDKGCIGSTTTPIVINPYISLDAIAITVTAPITCTNLENITVSVNATGGTPSNLEFTLVDVNASTGVQGALFPSETNTTGDFANLPVADYLVTVTNLETGCTVSDYYYVNNPNTFVLEAVKTSDVICFGGIDGAVDLTIIDQLPTPTNDAGEFTYIISGPTPSVGTSTATGTVSLSGLAAGLYTVTATLTNSPYCDVTTTFTISGPSAALEISETYTAITCISGNNDGTISVTATGGWAGGYEYQVLKNNTLFADYSTTTDYANLEAGNYTINVRDSKGCVDTVIVPLVIPTPITVTAVANPTLLLCEGDQSGTVTATNVAGGQGSNYLYTLNYLSLTPVVSSGPQVDPMFTGLRAGTYSITVTDGYNCSADSAPVTITEPTIIEANLVESRTQTCLTLTQLTLSATGGTGPYTYSTDNSAYSTTTFATSVSFDVSPGVYQYYVKDANGCVDFISNEIAVEALVPLTVVLDIDNIAVNCKGDASGVIVAKATGGLGNYVYSLFDGANNEIAAVQSTPGRFDGLVAGFYQVKVVSGDCNVASAIVEVTEPLAPLTSTYVVTPVVCNGEKNGRIDITATGGTGQIQFAISPRMDQFFNSGTFENLAPGTYQVVVQDASGCFHLIDFDIAQPEILAGSVIASSVIPEVCEGDLNGAFAIEIAGGVGPYSVSLDELAGPYTQGAVGQVDFAFNALSGGTHKVYIKDSLGCESEFEYALPDPVILNPTYEVTYDCVNNAQSNRITIVVDDSNDPADVTYQLDGVGAFQASNIFIDVTATSHFVVARHVNGCEKMTDIFDVDQVDPLALTIGDGEMNEIVATATGGGGDYEYSFNGESFSTNNKFVFYKSDNYTVIVRDKNGCEVSVTQYFEYIDVCIPNYFTPNGDGNQDTWAPGCTNIYPDLTFNIFDRYGRVVGKYRLGQGWDGKYQGSELPTGDYWYVLKLNNNKDDREFVGHFTLYR